jgi:hypothetical protein
MDSSRKPFLDTDEWESSEHMRSGERPSRRNAHAVAHRRLVTNVGDLNDDEPDCVGFGLKELFSGDQWSYTSLLEPQPEFKSVGDAMAYSLLSLFEKRSNTKYVMRDTVRLVIDLLQDQQPRCRRGPDVHYHQRCR